VNLYFGCNSDATSNKTVAMEKRYYCEIIAFFVESLLSLSVRVAYSDFDNIFFMISDSNYSATVGISPER
jgi:hypothetical protein